MDSYLIQQNCKCKWFLKQIYQYKMGLLIIQIYNMMDHIPK